MGYNMFMSEIERVDPRIENDVNKLRDAINSFKKAQDPKLKEVLRKEALTQLYETADTIAICDMEKAVLSEFAVISEN